MLSDLKKNNINENAVFEKVTAKENLDIQLNLPDYCSDIKRILKCNVEPSVSSASLKGGKLSADGGVTVRIIYVGDNDKIDCYESVSDLSVSSDIKDPPEGSVLTFKAKTDYINCRAMSQRRVSVSGSVSVCFTVYYEKKSESVCSCEERGVQLKKFPFKAQSLIAEAEKSFDLSETISLSNDRGDIAKILSYGGFCVIDSKKAVSGKLLLKGEMTVDVVYLPDKEENRVVSLRHTMPVNQIVDLPGIDEKSLCTEKISLSRLMVNPKADSAGKNRLIEIAAKLSVFITCNEVKDFECTLDCYSTDYEIETKYELKDFFCPLLNINEEKEVKKVFEIPKGLSELLFAFSPENAVKISFKEEKGEISGGAIISIFYLDEKGTPSFCEKTLDFEHSFKLPEKAHSPVGSAECIIKNITASPVGKNSLDITATILLKADVFKAERKKICTHIDLNEDMKKEPDGAALTVYFSDKGESLWDIAKKYNTTVLKIKEENGLSAEKTEECRMLMIPAI